MMVPLAYTKGFFLWYQLDSIVGEQVRPYSCIQFAWNGIHQRLMISPYMSIRDTYVFYIRRLLNDETSNT